MSLDKAVHKKNGEGNGSGDSGGVGDLQELQDELLLKRTVESYEVFKSALEHSELENSQDVDGPAVEENYLSVSCGED